MLVNSCGSHTRAVSMPERPARADDDARTFIQQPADKAPSHLDYWLVDQGAIHPLKVGINTIGRLPDNDVVIQGPYVSRRHCAILVHAGDGCELHDIASKNGTYLNGQKLSGPTLLATGDEIRMCDRQLIFCSKKDAAARSNPDCTLAD
jgi:FHA domain